MRAPPRTSAPLTRTTGNGRRSGVLSATDAAGGDGGWAGVVADAGSGAGGPVTTLVSGDHVPNSTPAMVVTARTATRLPMSAAATG
jgi:hypothetical protein